MGAPSVFAIDHIVLNVADVEISALWYERVLGMHRSEFTPSGDATPRVALTFGRQKINLRPVNAKREEWFTALHPVPGSADLCFLTEQSPDSTADHLRAECVPLELGPVQKRGALGTLVSVYCRDPDGNLIEISSYQSP
jgi:catechol 2,3-dioxygenase-like lactoylglutathione lyase family enzyme